MKILFFFFFLLFAGNALAQQTVAVKDIRKISLVDAEGALMFGRVTRFDLVPDKDQWLCYQTSQHYQHFGRSPREKVYEGLDSDQPKLIKSISNKTIGDLLKTIATIKPKLDPASFGITPQKLINDVDTDYLKNWGNRLSEHQHAIFMHDLDNVRNINESISWQQTNWWTDDSPYCGIYIIKNNNDTVKVESHRQPDMMLPWLINGQPTFDLAINRFFVAAMGDYPYSAKYRLEGRGLPRQIEERIYDSLAMPHIIIDDWKARSPDIYKQLTANFKVSKLAHDNSNISCRLTSNKLPRAFVIQATLKMDDAQGLKNLLAYRDTLAHDAASNNFVLNYYKSKEGCTVTFKYDTLGPYLYDGIYSRKFKKWIAAHPQQGVTAFRMFIVDNPSERDLTTWVMLPGNKLLLLDYINPQFAGLNLKLDGTRSHRTFCMIEFDSTGKQLTEPEYGMN